MNVQLQQLLSALQAEDQAWQHRNDHAAATARKTGNLAEFFDFAYHQRLPDTCWALQHWQDACHYYRHNAEILRARRIWHATHSGPDYPLNELLDWEATAQIKAGNLTEGVPILEQAIAHWRQQPEAALILTSLGLHAAQAGQPNLAEVALAIIPARQALVVTDSAAAVATAAILHYEPAEIALLLGNWDALQQHLEHLSEVEHRLHKHPLPIFPAPLQAALLAAIKGLQHFWSLKTGRVAVESAAQQAIAAFEEAMLHFYAFSGNLDWNLYFMRLNTCLVKDVLVGRSPNPSPCTAYR